MDGLTSTEVHSALLETTKLTSSSTTKQKRVVGISGTCSSFFFYSLIQFLHEGSVGSQIYTYSHLNLLISEWGRSLGASRNCWNKSTTVQEEGHFHFLCHPSDRRVEKRSHSTEHSGNVLYTTAADTSHCAWWSMLKTHNNISLSHMVQRKHKK